MYKATIIRPPVVFFPPPLKNKITNVLPFPLEPSAAIAQLAHPYFSAIIRRNMIPVIHFLSSPTYLGPTLPPALHRPPPSCEIYVR